MDPGPSFPSPRPPIRPPPTGRRSPMSKESRQPQSAQDVNRETDARVWAQTGSKPGQPLDMKDPSDKARSTVGRDVYAQVAGEASAGKMVRTFDDPTVADHLDHATIAYLAALNHTVCAAAAKDDKIFNEHLRAAKEANQIARDSAEAAAKHQPPSITKFILDQARAQLV